jgi:hypothetical protein
VLAGTVEDREAIPVEPAAGPAVFDDTATVLTVSSLELEIRS